MLKMLLGCRCGPKLHAVFTGQQDPLELLFPGGNMDDATAIYSDTPSAQLYNTLVRSAIEALVYDSVTESTTLQLLEIGAGTGATTMGILPLLPAELSQYWFTDLSYAFLRSAQKRFQRPYPFVRYAIFNAELDPVEQGFVAHSMDAVVAVNVLHATRNLSETLTNTRRILHPQGVLILSEITEHYSTAGLDCWGGLQVVSHRKNLMSMLE